MVYERLKESLRNILKKGIDMVYRTKPNKFTRERKMEQKDFVWYLIMQKERTTSMELDEYLKHKNGTYEISISKQAFSKQRQFLKPEIFKDINQDYLTNLYRYYPNEVKTYKGYHVCAIDGSLFELPNTKELRELYETQKNSSGHRESARARVSGIYDVENGFMINALIASCKESEKTLALQNIEHAGSILDLSKSIFIFDRGYSGVELIYTLEKLHIKYIFRLQSTMYKEERSKMKNADEWVDLKTTGDRLRKVSNEVLKAELKVEKTIPVRIIEVVLDSGESEYLLSNIDQEVISSGEMKEAYYKRWSIEIGYDILKNKLHVENFTGKTKITIEQDFYAQLYTFNILQDIKNTANKKVQEKHKEKELKYEYKPNINILAGWLKNIVVAIIFTKTEEEKGTLFELIIEKAEKNLVPIKPNRAFERKEYSGRNKYKTNLRNNM